MSKSDFRFHLPHSLASRVLLVFVANALILLLGWKFFSEYFRFPDTKKPGHEHFVLMENNMSRIFAEKIVHAPTDAIRQQLCNDSFISAVIINEKKMKEFQCGPLGSQLPELQNTLATDISDHDRVEMKEVLYEGRIDNKLVLALPTMEVARLRLKKFTLIFSIAAILLLFLTYGIVSKMLHPLRKLVFEIEQFGEGKRNVPNPMKRKDEVGQLSVAFHAMAVQIGELIKSKEQVLVDISHELRSPLTRLRLNIEMSESSENDMKPMLADINEIERLIAVVLEGARMNHRNDQFILEPAVALNFFETLCSSIASRSSQYASLKYHVHRGEGESAIQLQLDHRYMEIMLLNLIDNACRHSRGAAKPVEVSIQIVDGSLCRIVVRDFGAHGIPAAERQHVFEPFYRLDKARTPGSGGFGLGLNIVKRIVEGHHGKVFIDPNVTVGTAVVVELPVSGKVTVL